MTLPSDTLRFTVEAPAQARAGASIPITLRLTNTGDHTIELHLLGREIAFDVVITAADGAPVWRRLKRAVIAGILQLKPLPAGQSLEFRATWTQQDDSGALVPPGEYRVQGILPTDGEPLRSRTARVRIATP